MAIPIRYFPIRLPSGKALEADQANLTIKEYQVGRDCQLWFTVNDTIRSKRHPEKAITVEDGWNDRGWGKLYLHPTGNLQLKTQKWKFADNGEIFSLCRNTRRPDALKLAWIGSEIVCSSKAESCVFNFSTNQRRQGEKEKEMELNTSLVANSNGTVTVMRALPPDIHKDLECVVCLEMMGTGHLNERIYQCTQSHLICYQCRPRLSQCPICREFYFRLFIRNRMAENIAEFIAKN